MTSPVCNEKNSVVFMFSTKNENWSDSTESIQKQKILKLAQSDTLVKEIESSNVPPPDWFRPEPENGTRSAGKAPEDDAELDEVYHVFPQHSRSGEIAILMVTISRPESRIFVADEVTTSGTNVSEKGVPKEMTLIQVIEECDNDPRDKNQWKYLRRPNKYKKNGKFFKRWFGSSDYSDSKTLGRSRMTVTCPNCTFSVRTIVKHVNSVRTRRSACLFSPIGLCGLPFVFFMFKDAVHVCPFCGIYLGFCPAFRYTAKADVVTDVITNPINCLTVVKMGQRMKKAMKERAERKKAR